MPENCHHHERLTDHIAFKEEQKTILKPFIHLNEQTESNNNFDR